MPSYSQITLSDLTAQISGLLNDESAVFWTVPEINLSIYEALRVFGSCTSFWRSRGTFNINPRDQSPFYDLNKNLPLLRTRTWTVGQMVKEIQYHLLESPTGVAGTDGSGQVSISIILRAIQHARNRFVIDVHFPNTNHQNYEPATPPNGLVYFDQSSVFVHRASWQDAGGAWRNLWRDDTWVYDHSDTLWTGNPGTPISYSEAELAPLILQIFPPPLGSGTLDAVTVDSLLVDTSTDASTFNIPDEWIYAVKYAAMEEILSGGNQIVDPMRAQYCGQRYQQAVDMAKDAMSLIRLTCNGTPLPIDSMANIDAGYSTWRNQTGRPTVAGVMYDLVAMAPGFADQTYGIGADVVTPAPLPTTGQFIPVGEENLQDITDYAVNYLMLKCGGNEMKSTMGLLDNFQRAIATRKGANAAKIRYFQPLFGMWQNEQAMRPDVRMATK